ncbi:hypothetical protein NLX83_01775 [Allokutzneria sp. A3M-2-11 16]|uniref:hypothetical protein n=1 Tax=Allokutzneria sp. A3M-2-11 16 TaxID=2962043 RepID=UPI0020B79F58|nr:hypothetical protein [Allokutzneria sp. A3M-2-11 16]MCP3797978.1 hypothetical protein [Allokutzneria sp. A3M-2-11 16]
MPRQAAGALLFARGDHDTAEVRDSINATEPDQLYGLIALALVLHYPGKRSGLCMRCGVTWPCEQVRLAFRLREGF